MLKRKDSVMMFRLHAMLITKPRCCERAVLNVDGEAEETIVPERAILTFLLTSRASWLFLVLLIIKLLEDQLNDYEFGWIP